MVYILRFGHKICINGAFLASNVFFSLRHGRLLCHFLAPYKNTISCARCKQLYTDICRASSLL